MSKKKYLEYLERRREKKAAYESYIFRKGTPKEQAAFLESLRTSNPNYYEQLTKRPSNVPYGEAPAALEEPTSTYYDMYKNAPVLGPSLPSGQPTQQPVSVLTEKPEFKPPTVEKSVNFWETPEFKQQANKLITLMGGKPAPEATPSTHLVGAVDVSASPTLTSEVNKVLSTVGVKTIPTPSNILLPRHADTPTIKPLTYLLSNGMPIQVDNKPTITDENIGQLKWNEQVNARTRAAWSELITGKKDYNYDPHNLFSNPLGAIFTAGASAFKAVITKPVGTGTNVLGAAAQAGFNTLITLSDVGKSMVKETWSGIVSLDYRRRAWIEVLRGNQLQANVYYKMANEVFTSADDKAARDLTISTNIMVDSWKALGMEWDAREELLSESRKRADEYAKSHPGISRESAAKGAYYQTVLEKNQAAREQAVLAEENAFESWKAKDPESAVPEMERAIRLYIEAEPYNRYGAYTWQRDPEAYDAFVKDIAFVTLQKGAPLTEQEVQSIREHHANAATEMTGEMIFDPMWLVPQKVWDAMFVPVKLAAGLAWTGIKATPIIGDFITFAVRESASSGAQRVGRTTINFLKRFTEAYETSDEVINALDDVQRLAVEMNRTPTAAEATALWESRRMSVKGLQLFSQSDFNLIRGIASEKGISEGLNPARWAGELRKSVAVMEDKFMKEAIEQATEELGEDASKFVIRKRAAQIVADKAMSTKYMLESILDFSNKVTEAYITPRRVYVGSHLNDDSILGNAVRFLREVAGQSVNEKAIKDVRFLFKDRSVELPDKFAAWVSQVVGTNSKFAMAASDVAKWAEYYSTAATHLRDAWTMFVLSNNPAWVVRNYVDSSFRHIIYGGNLFDDIKTLRFSLQRQVEEAIGVYRIEMAQGLARVNLPVKYTLATRFSEGWKPGTNPFSYVFSYFKYEYQRLGAEHTAELVARLGTEGASMAEKNVFNATLAFLRQTGTAIPGTIGDLNTAIEYTLRLRMFHDEFFKGMEVLQPKMLDMLLEKAPEDMHPIIEQAWEESGSNPAKFSTMLDRLAGVKVDGKADWTLLMPPDLKSAISGMDYQTQKLLIEPVQEQLDGMITSILKNGRKPAPEDFNSFFDNIRSGLQNEIQAKAAQQGDQRAISSALNTIGDVAEPSPTLKGPAPVAKPEKVTPQIAIERARKLNKTAFPASIRPTDKLAVDFEQAITPYATMKRVAGDGVTVTMENDKVVITLGDELLKLKSSEFYDILHNTTIRAKAMSDMEYLNRAGIKTADNYLGIVNKFIRDPAKLASENERDFLTIYHQLHSDPHYEDLLQRTGKRFTYESAFDLYRDSGALSATGKEGFPSIIDRLLTEADKEVLPTAEYRLSGIEQAIGTRRIGSLIMDTSLPEADRVMLRDYLNMTANTRNQFHLFGFKYFPGPSTLKGDARRNAWNMFYKIMSDNYRSNAGEMLSIVDAYAKDPAAGRALLEQVMTNFEDNFLARSGISVHWDADHQLIMSVDFLRNGRKHTATDATTVESIFNSFYSDFAHHVMNINKPVRIDINGMIPVREQMTRALRNTFELNQTQADTLFSVIEAHASAFEAETGKPADLFYSKVGFQKVGTGGELLNAKNLMEYQGGALQILPNGQYKLYGAANADFNTAIESLLGVFYQDLRHAAQNGSTRAIDALDNLTAHMVETTGKGIKKTLTVEQTRELRDLFVRYVTEDNAPTVKLVKPFERIKNWMSDIYKNIPENLPEEYSPEMRQFFDTILTESESVAPSATARLNRLTAADYGLGELPSEELLKRINQAIESNKFEYSVGSDTFNRVRTQILGAGFSEDEADAVLRIWDARARSWAEANGKSADEFFKQNLRGFTGAPAPESMVNRPSLYQTDPVYKAYIEWAQERNISESEIVRSWLRVGQLDDAELDPLVKKFLTDDALWGPNGKYPEGIFSLRKPEDEIIAVYRNLDLSAGIPEGRWTNDASAAVNARGNGQIEIAFVTRGEWEKAQQAATDEAARLANKEKTAPIINSGEGIFKEKPTETFMESELPNKKLTWEGVYPPAPGKSFEERWAKYRGGGPKTVPGGQLYQGIRGSTAFLDDGRAVIRAFKKEGADLSTLLHESWHVFRRTLPESDLRIVEKWTGLSEGQFDSLRPAWEEYRGLLTKKDLSATEVSRLTALAEDAIKYEMAEEKWAVAGERYLRAGKAPIPQLEDIFTKLKNWLTEIYRTIKGSSLEKVKMSQDIVGVFDRSLSYTVKSPKYRNLGDVPEEEARSLFAQITGQVPKPETKASAEIKKAWAVLKKDMPWLPAEHAQNPDAAKAYIKARMAEEWSETRDMLNDALWRIEQWQDAMTTHHAGTDFKELAFPAIPVGKMESGMETWVAQRANLLSEYEQANHALTMWNEYLNKMSRQGGTNVFRRYTKDQVASLMAAKELGTRLKADMVSTIVNGGSLHGTNLEGAVTKTNRVMLDYQNGNVFDQVMQNFFPFWKFPSRSMPFWVEALATHPEIIATYNKYQEMSRSQLYQAGATTSKGAVKPSMQGYIRIPGTDMWYNPLSPLSFQYLLDRATGKPTYVGSFNQGDDQEPMAYLTQQFIETSNVYGFNLAPWVVMAAKGALKLPDTVAPPSPIIPQMNLMPRWWIPDTIRMGRMGTLPTLKDLWYPEVKGQDYIIENRILSDLVRKVEDPNVSEDDKLALMSDAEEAIKNKKDNALWQKTYKMVENEGALKSFGSFFTGIYVKQFTDGQMELNHLRDQNTLLRSTMNNYWQAKIFDVPTDAKQAWAYYQQQQDTPQAWINRINTKLGWVTGPEGNLTTNPQERAKYLALNLEQEDITRAHWAAIEELTKQYNTKLQKLKIGSPYEKKAIVYSWYREEIANINKQYPLTYERRYGTYKPVELIHQEIANQWYRLLNSTKPTWNVQAGEDYRNYLKRVEEWQADMPKFAPELLQNFQDRQDILDILHSMHTDQAAQFAGEQFWMDLMNTSNTEGILYHDMQNDSVFDALNKAHDALVFKPYWESMLDPNTGEYLKGDAFNLAQYDFYDSHPMPNAQDYFNWITQNYGDRFTLDEISKWVNYSGALNPEEQQIMAHSEDYKFRQEIWDILSWGGPSTGQDAIRKAMALQTEYPAGTIDTWYDTQGQLFSDDPAKLKLFHDMLLKAAQGINLVPPSREKLVEYVAAQQQNAQFKQVVLDKLGSDMLEPTETGETLPDGTKIMKKSVLDMFYGNGTTNATRAQLKHEHWDDWLRVREYYRLRAAFADKNQAFARYYLGKNVTLTPESLMKYGGRGEIKPVTPTAPAPITPTRPGQAPESQMSMAPSVSFPSGFVSTVGTGISQEIVQAVASGSGLSPAQSKLLRGLASRHPEWAQFVNSILT